MYFYPFIIPKTETNNLGSENEIQNISLMDVLQYSFSVFRFIKALNYKVALIWKK